MNRRRVVAAGFLTAVIVAVLAVIAYTEHVNAAQTVSVWVLTHTVTGGAPYAGQDVQRVEMRAPSGDFNYLSLGPDAYAGRYARNLNSGDILRQDDVVPAGQQVEVAITVQDPPPLSPGDQVDIFATFAGDQQALIGRGVEVETVSAGALTILIPAADEQAWVAVGSSSVALHVARAAPGSAPESSPVSAESAIRLLCGAPCSVSVEGASASP